MKFVPRLNNLTKPPYYLVDDVIKPHASSSNSTLASYLKMRWTRPGSSSFWSLVPRLTHVVEYGPAEDDMVGERAESPTSILDCSLLLQNFLGKRP